MSRSRSIAPPLVIAVLAAGAALTGCGGATAPVSGPTSPASVKPDLTHADPRLRNNYREADKLIGGGRQAFDRGLAKLHGLPVVVNKWASWCRPCLTEFPLFQQAAKARGGKVAFLGVNVSDGAANATDFLKRHPVPYPSYVDDGRIAELLPPAGGAPVTAFFDATGRRTHVKAGEYKSLPELLADIDRYAPAR